MNIAKNRVTAVVPVFRMDRARKRAYKVVLDRLRREGFTDIVEVLQLPPGKRVPKTVPEGVRREVVRIAGKHMAKGALMNAGACASRRSWLLLLDADVVLPFSDVLDAVPDGAEVVQPFGRILKLTRAMSGLYAKGRLKAVPLGKVPSVEVFGGGAVLLRREAFQRVRGYDERFVGWGCEDVELGARLRALFGVVVLSRFRGVHLWHRDVSKRSRREVQKANRELLAESLDAVAANVLDAIGAVVSRVRGKVGVVPPVMHDTAMVTCAYGLNDAREAAAREGVAHWLEQASVPARIVIVELRFSDKEAFRLADLDGAGSGTVVHLGITGTEDNRGIFQKEALFNIGARSCAEPVLVFSDIDIYSLDPVWLWLIRAKVLGRPRVLVQGFGLLRDSKLSASEFTRWSYAYQRLIQGADNIGRAPGGIWGMSRAFFDDIGGWNVWFLPGSGDSGFVIEHLRDEGYSQTPMQWPYWRRAIRKGQPQGVLDVVPCDAVHAWHGDVGGRAYLWSRLVVGWFCEDVRERVMVDEQGLVKWRRQRDPLKYVLLRKPRLRSLQTTREVVTEAYLWAGKLDGGVYACFVTMAQDLCKGAVRAFEAMTVPTVREQDAGGVEWVLAVRREDAGRIPELRTMAEASGVRVRFALPFRGEALSDAVARVVSASAARMDAERVVTMALPFGGAVHWRFASEVLGLAESRPEERVEIVFQNGGAVLATGEIRIGRRVQRHGEEFRCLSEPRIFGTETVARNEWENTTKPRMGWLAPSGRLRWLVVPCWDGILTMRGGDVPEGFRVSM